MGRGRARLRRSSRVKGRLTCLGLALATILAGLALRVGPWRPPLAVHHYGGSVLWGMMLMAWAAAFRPRWSRLTSCLAVASLAAVCIELVRLVHTPELDAFRRTLAGQLLLGSLFSIWNLPAYAVGIALMAALVRPTIRRSPPEPVDPGPIA